jgi:deazaflavin-dependent oxidoreductase (nitroreductase family)
VAQTPDAPQANSPFWWVWERFTSFHTAAYKATKGKVGGKFQGAPIALVDSVGRKSGKRRTHPLLAREDGENLIIVASKGGIRKNPAWYHNLRANPDTVANWYGDVRTVRARELEGAEREEMWLKMTEIYPTYRHYQRRTDRQIPVLLLEPNGDAP